jgi:hypothetical protein
MSDKDHCEHCGESLPDLRIKIVRCPSCRKELLGEDGCYHGTVEVTHSRGRKVEVFRKLLEKGLLADTIPHTPGAVVTRMSEADREILTDLRSEDLQDRIP